MSRSDLPKVPLEAGASPVNPPCPACGEPLFAWLAVPPHLVDRSRRCESCGLGLIVERDGDETPVPAAAALAALDQLTEAGRIAFDDRQGLAASSLGNVWAGLKPGRRFYFTAESIRRLAADRDQLVNSKRWRPLAGIGLAWQSLINLLTFGRNVGMGWFGQEGTELAEPGWRRWLDGFITVAVALPALIVAVPLELIGGLFRRGGSTAVKLVLL